MTISKQLKTFARLHYLIQRKATGCAETLARKFNCSRATIYRFLEELKSFGAKIAYCHNDNSFIYQNDFDLDFNKIARIKELTGNKMS